MVFTTFCSANTFLRICMTPFALTAVWSSTPEWCSKIAAMVLGKPDITNVCFAAGRYVLIRALRCSSARFHATTNSSGLTGKESTS